MIIHSEPAFDNHSFMVCNWVNEQGIEVFQERTYWPRRTYGKALCNLNTNVTVHYWLTDFLYYESGGAAKQEAERFGFVLQKGFYCDDNDPHWFPIFTDFDKVLAFLQAKTGIVYECEPEPVTA